METGSLRISDIRTCSIFIDPDSTHNFKDSVVTLNDWNTMSEDMMTDVDSLANRKVLAETIKYALIVVEVGRPKRS